MCTQHPNITTDLSLVSACQESTIPGHVELQTQDEEAAPFVCLSALPGKT